MYELLPNDRYELILILVPINILHSLTDNCGEKYQALLLALHKLKMSDEQRKSAIDTYEPLATFALSCGMYSSPAVIFTLLLFAEGLIFVLSRKSRTRAGFLCFDMKYINAGKNLHC